MITRSMERTIGVYPNPRVLKYTRLTRYRSTRELACASLDAPFGTYPQLRADDEQTGSYSESEGSL